MQTATQQMQTTQLKPLAKQTQPRERDILRKLILTGSLMAENQRIGQKMDKALADNWEHLLTRCRDLKQFN